MSENIKKITKAFKVDLDSRENQSILKPSARLFNHQAHQVNEAAKKIYELIENAKHPNDDIILNHSEIKEAFFSPFEPQLKNAQVFLSHSHADKNKALKVKNYLEEDLDAECVFIDSLFWDYKDNVLKEMSKYDNTSKIEDAFTLILRESLQDMIEKCPYFVFLQSDNSVSNQGLSRITYSAWIYEELKIAHSLIADSALQESRIKAMRVSHNITNLLRSLNLSLLIVCQFYYKGSRMKTYQKLLGASCLALYLVGCGSGGGAESPVEMSANSKGEFQISSKADSVTIQGVKLNRGNCVVSFVSEEEMVQRAGFAILTGVLPITPISMQDFKDMASVYKEFDQKERVANIENKISQLKQKGVMMEPQTLKFGESLKGISQGCNIMEAEIQTNKGAWTFNFNR